MNEFLWGFLCGMAFLLLIALIFGEDSEKKYIIIKDSQIEKAA